MPKKTIGLYIHIPFCKTICTFCNFLTFANKNKWIPNYIEALEMEIEIKATNFLDYSIETVYFGGGTPSLIDPLYIVRILDAIRAHFDCQNILEISLEANPESIDLKRLETYAKAGVNRISLGVQSLNPKTLLKVARPHNDQAVFQALENIKAGPIQNFGCDLIMGLPYQTLPEFQEHLEILLKYKPTHLSAYFLSYDTKRIDTFIKDSPNEETQISMYWHLQKRLSESGFKHYEVSNYALPGHESKHNLRYWKQQEYLGLGLGAHSYFDQKVSENTRKFDEYLKNPLELEDSYPLDQDTQRMDYIMLRLRTNEGIQLKDFESKFGLTELNTLSKKAKSLDLPIQLIVNDNQIALTNEGMLFADQIYQKLI